MKAIRNWIVLGGIIVLTPNLMGGCADELGDIFRGVADDLDDLENDDDDDDIDDFFDDLFDDDDDD